jgi:general stress protein YciG
MTENTQDHPSGKQGFASMDPKKQRQIASMGGSSVPAEKRPFAQNHRLAAEAGRKGGMASRGRQRARTVTEQPVEEPRPPH